MKICSNIIALKYKCIYNSLLFLNKNNSKTKKYQEEGLKFLEGKVDNLPQKIAFKPKFIKQSCCVKVFDKLYIFISKSNLLKSDSEKFDSLFHEIGHWLHFQNIPPLKQCREIWQKVNREKIKTDVSEYALKKDDGREFVAEVFKGLIKGKKYDEYIMQLYKKLNGPNVKTNITQNI